MIIADKFLHGALVPIHVYLRTKVQRPSSINVRDMEEVPK